MESYIVSQSKWEDNPDDSSNSNNPLLFQCFVSATNLVCTSVLFTYESVPNMNMNTIMKRCCQTFEMHSKRNKQRSNQVMILFSCDQFDYLNFNGSIINLATLACIVFTLSITLYVLCKLSLAFQQPQSRVDQLQALNQLYI